MWFNVVNVANVVNVNLIPGYRIDLLLLHEIH